MSRDYSTAQQVWDSLIKMTVKANGGGEIDHLTIGRETAKVMLAPNPDGSLPSSYREIPIVFVETDQIGVVPRARG